MRKLTKSRPWLSSSLLAFLSLSESVAVSATSVCDESKCRGVRTHPWVDGDTEWTCWVPVGTNVTDLCAEGLEGQVVEDVPPEEIEGSVRVWITCCPPGYQGAVEQQCSDRACSSPDWEGGGNCWADGFQEPMTCSSGKYRYPRWTGLMSMIYLQYVCCTSPSNDSSTMQELLVARVIWVVLSSITFVVCMVFIVAIVSDKKTRKQGYNLYLVFLAIPDALANLFIIVRNSLTIHGAPVNPTVHIFLASAEYFYAASNMWLNGLIVGQIHYVLLKSNRFVKVPPPSVSTVSKQAAGIYLFALCWFGWAFFLYYKGLVLFPLDQVVNIWIVTRVLMVAPPLIYVVYVCANVWRHNLLPRSGRTRVLSLYFLRVVFVFVTLWVPYFIIYEIAWNVTHSRTMVHISYFLGSIQGLVSVAVALSKPDIKRAVIKFVSCSHKHRLGNVAGTSQDDSPTTESTLHEFAGTSQQDDSPKTEATHVATTTEISLRNDDQVRADRRQDFRKSTFFNQSQTEWNMDDDWPTIHDTTESDEENHQGNDTLPGGILKGNRHARNSTLFRQKQNEWSMDDVWASSGKHDITETDENQQTNDTLSGGIQKGNQHARNSSLFRQKQNEWSMDDVWASSGNHDITETDENQQTNDTLSGAQP